MGNRNRNRGQNRPVGSTAPQNQSDVADDITDETDGGDVEESLGSGDGQIDAAGIAAPDETIPQVKTYVAREDNLNRGMTSPIVHIDGPAAMSRSAVAVTDLLNQYTNLMSKDVLTDAQVATGAKILGRAIDTMINTPETDTLQIFWDFCREHQGDLMHERKAMRGVSSLSKIQFNRVSVLVTAFVNSVRGDHGRIGGSGPIVEHMKKLVGNNPSIQIFLQSKRT